MSRLKTYYSITHLNFQMPDVRMLKDHRSGRGTSRDRAHRAQFEVAGIKQYATDDRTPCPFAHNCGSGLMIIVSEAMIECPRLQRITSRLGTDRRRYPLFLAKHLGAKGHDRRARSTWWILFGGPGIAIYITSVAAFIQEQAPGWMRHANTLRIIDY